MQGRETRTPEMSSGIENRRAVTHQINQAQPPPRRHLSDDITSVFSPIFADRHPPIATSVRAFKDVSGVGIKWIFARFKVAVCIAAGATWTFNAPMFDLLLGAVGIAHNLAATTRGVVQSRSLKPGYFFVNKAPTKKPMPAAINNDELGFSCTCSLTVSNTSLALSWPCSNRSDARSPRCSAVSLATCWMLPASVSAASAAASEAVSLTCFAAWLCPCDFDIRGLTLRLIGVGNTTKHCFFVPTAYSGSSNATTLLATSCYGSKRPPTR